MKIGCIGPQGTFSQEALSEFMPEGSKYEQVLFSSIPELILASNEGIVDYALYLIP